MCKNCLKNFMNHAVYALLLQAFLPLFWHSGGYAGEDSLAKAMADYLECYPVELVSLKRQKPAITRQDVCLASIYHEMGAVPLWVTPEGPSEKADKILYFLENADKEGLEPGDYQVGRLAELWLDRSYDSLAVLDTLLTYNIVKYIHDVSHGQLKPFMADPELYAEAGEIEFDPVVTVEALYASSDIEEFLLRLPPGNRHYQGLKKGLAHYRLIAKQGDWQVLPAAGTISPGDSDERITAVRERLAVLLGDKSIPGHENPQYYDQPLEEQVARFQHLHGLKVDRIIGRNTMKELNVSPSRRIEQIKINMARWRWQDHNLGDDYVIVNIANFQLDAYRQGELRLSLPVIVGKFQHQTPVFSDSIKYVEFNPYWNVPQSIALKEELPELRKNPNYLADRHIRLFSSWGEDAEELDSTLIDWQLVSRREMAQYKLRQDPGPSNALGRIKFVFPNHYAVYIHDTPAKNLFSERHRFFSHGCIRVSSPEKLAEFVLDETASGWDMKAVREAIEKGRRKVVRLGVPIPIHITYQTAWLDKNNQIHFNRDVYARDEKLFKALFQK